MSIRDPLGPQPQGASAFVATVIGVVCFGAFAILGLGMLTYFADVDIISVEGLPLWPAIVGMAAAIAVFAGMLRPVLTSTRPSYASVVLVAVIAAVAHVAVVWLGALLSGVGLAHATAAASQLVTLGSSFVVLAAALIAAWIAVALRRAQDRPPRWPWERAEDE